MSNTAKGGIIGGTAGAAVGAGAGVGIAALAGKSKKKGAIIGAAAGAAVGTTAGILIGKTALDEFAKTMSDMTDTNIQVFGHTDNTGSYEANQKVSNSRANSVANYLKSKGIDASRVTTVMGMAYDDPVADNSTAAGRAQNRRVEIYISASPAMIEAAEAEAK